MGGERNLNALLSGLSLYRHDGIWAFQHHSENHFEAAIMTFREREGWTGIVPASRAAATPQWAWLELAIHSDLEAVGFLAAITTALADKGIACNAVSAVYHDHLFVPYDRADDAIDVLRRLQKSASDKG